MTFETFDGFTTFERVDTLETVETPERVETVAPVELTDTLRIQGSGETPETLPKTPQVPSNEINKISLSTLSTLSTVSRTPFVRAREGSPMSAAAVLRWLNENARQIILQDLRADGRQKNRVIMEYQTPGSTELDVVGSQSLASAVCRAQTRIDAKDGKA